MISASIMSKKIAEGTASLVLDVKTGAGAFMKTLRASRRRSRGRWWASAQAAGVNTVALITDMDTPLGRTAGNGLRGGRVGRGARRRRAGRRRRTHPGAGPRDAGLRRHRRRPGRGAGVRQGDGRLEGDDPRPGRRPGRAAAGRPAHRGGRGRRPTATVTGLDAMAVGLAAWRLGAGRAKQGDPVQAAAGVTWHAGRRRRGAAGPAAVHAAHRHPRAHRAGAGGARRRGRRSAPSRARARVRSCWSGSADPTHPRTRQNPG